MSNNLMYRTAVLVMGFGFIMPMNTASADSAYSDDHESFAKLSAEWWQWAASIPSAANPLVTTNGDCMVGQRGDIWFLSGVFNGSGPITRTCALPEGVSLFFPLINNVNINTPNVCGQGPNDISVKELRAQVAPVMDAAHDLSVEIDGHKVDRFRRVQSKVFYVALPEDNIFNPFCGGPGTVPTGVYSPAIDDGFYARIHPLKPGMHTLHFHAENPNATQDVTYTLQVIPLNRH